MGPVLFSRVRGPNTTQSTAWHIENAFKPCHQGHYLRCAEITLRAGYRCHPFLGLVDRMLARFSLQLFQLPIALLLLARPFFSKVAAAYLFQDLPHVLLHLLIGKTFSPC